SASCGMPPDRRQNPRARIAPRNPKSAPLRRFEYPRHVTRGLTVGADKKRAHGVVAERCVEQKIELCAAYCVGQRGETIEIIERLRDFRRAAMPVAHLPFEPARIGGASAQG